VQLIEVELESKPNHTFLLSVLAELHAKRGDHRKALETLTRLMSLVKDEPDVWFIAAKAYEITGSRDDALAALDRALQSGYSQAGIEAEPELVELRRDVRFHRLLIRYQAGATP